MTDKIMLEIADISEDGKRLKIRKQNGLDWIYNLKDEIEPIVLQELIKRKYEKWAPLAFAEFKIIKDKLLHLEEVLL